MFDKAPVLKEDSYWDLAWHARLADAGDKDSQFIVADAYEYGKQIAPNIKKALIFYKKAAAQGHVEASMRLGDLYLSGTKIPADVPQAFQWFEKSAWDGNAQAQLKLAELYQSADYADMEKAYLYLEMAMRQLFPNTENLESVSPDLARLGRILKKHE